MQLTGIYLIRKSKPGTIMGVCVVIQNNRLQI